MVRFFVMRIHEGEMTIDEVPKLWQEKVKKELEES
ncbi:MAG: CD1375 family protein [Clostridium sp.]